MKVTLATIQAKLNDELNEGDGGFYAQEIMMFLEPHIAAYVTQEVQLATATSAEVKEELEANVAYQKAAARAFQTDLNIVNAKYLESEDALKVALAQLERTRRIMKLVSVEFTDEVVTLRESVEKSEFRDGDYDYFCEVAEEEVPDQ